MELWRLGVLRGPNRWAACPVLEASVEWNRPRPPLKLVVERLRSWLPSLDSEGSSLDEANNLAAILERLTLHLQIQVDQRVSFTQTRPGDRLGRYLVAVEYQHEAMGKACLQTAIQMCRAALLGQP